LSSIDGIHGRLVQQLLVVFKTQEKLAATVEPRLLSGLDPKFFDPILHDLNLVWYGYCMLKCGVATISVVPLALASRRIARLSSRSPAPSSTPHTTWL
jgi:hypothetical protein